MKDSLLYLQSPTQLSLSPRKRRRCPLYLSQERKCKKNKVSTPKCRRKTESELRRENATVGNSESEVQQHGRSKKLKLIGKHKSYNNQQTVDVKDQNKAADNKKTEHHQSSFASNCEEDDLDSDNQDVMEMDIVLVDVQVTVLASPQVRNVPFVSLRSESYGISVLGNPLDIGEIQDASETVLSEESGDRGSRFDKLVWRTSKRTPVCYVSTSLSASITKNVQPGPMLPAREKCLHKKGKSHMKLPKNRKQLDQGKPTLKKTCVPVELIFSKILAAVD